MLIFIPNYPALPAHSLTAIVGIVPVTPNALHNRAPSREAQRVPNGDAVWRSG
jgi:hypothetical protein